MSTTETPAAPSSAKDERRSAIVALANEIFLANGYAGASMAMIAARLGGSKATLYNYFGSKEELFVAVVEQKCEQILRLLYRSEIEGGGDFQHALTRFGERFLEMMLSEDTIAAYRLVTAESARFPELGRAVYESGIRQGELRLAEFMQRAKDAGQLRSDANVEVAAKQFFNLCKSSLHERRLWLVTPIATKDEIHAQISAAVATFITAYGA